MLTTSLVLSLTVAQQMLVIKMATHNLKELGVTACTVRHTINLFVSVLRCVDDRTINGLIWAPHCCYISSAIHVVSAGYVTDTSETRRTSWQSQNGAACGGMVVLCSARY